MVAIEEIIEDHHPSPVAVEKEKAVTVDEELPSDQRQNDANAIEQLSKTLVDRPTAQAHLNVLVTKLRQEASALKRVEASKARAAKEEEQQKKEAAQDEKKSEKDNEEDMDTVDDFGTTTAPPTSTSQPPSPKPVPVAAVPPAPSSLSEYVSIDKFMLDIGSYGSQYVTLYVELDGVGSIDRSNITCSFIPTSFDLVVRNLNHKNYRLIKDNLEHDIDPDSSKIIVKKNKVIIKLGKQKQEYGGYEHWTQLNAKKKKAIGTNGKTKPDDPSASIMNLMKDLYDTGDDNMKKMIAETMEKQRRGELGGRNGPGGGLGGGMDNMDMGI